MKETFYDTFTKFWEINVVAYIQNLQANPLRLISLIIDITIVVFLIYKFIKMIKSSRVWQLVKGIALLVALTLVSGWLHLDILHYLLTSIMTYVVIVMIVIFQP